MLSKEHAAVLAGIQNELLENEVDRIERSCQASPVYYGIIDFEKCVTAEGHHDLVEYYDTDRCCVLDEDEVARRIDEYMELSDDDRSHAVDHWHEDYPEVEPKYMAFRSFIRHNCMFLTRAEAEFHLAANRYNYTDHARTYAMTAWRGPQVERLLRVLHEADFTVEGDES